MSDLFRKSALEKLSSPEQLDKAVVITPPAFWIALLGGVLIIVGAVIWGVFGRLPINVEASGIYVSGDGTGSIYSQVEGIVTEVAVKDGETVDKDQVIAYVGGGELSNEVKSLGQRIKAVEKVTLDSRSDMVTADNKPLADIKTELIALTSTYEESQKSLDKKRSQLTAEESKMNGLLDKANALESSYYATLGSSQGSEAQIDYGEAQTTLASAKQAFASADGTLQQAQLQLDSSKSAYNKAKSDYEDADAYSSQQKSACDQLQDACGKKEQEIDQLTQSGGSAQEIQAAKDELASLQGQLSKAQAVYSKSQELLLSAQQASDKAQLAEESAQDAYQAASDNWNSSQADLDSAQSVYDSAKSDYIGALDTQAANSKNQTTANNDYSNALALYSAQKAIYQSVKQEADALQTQTEQAKSEIELKKQAIGETFSSTKDSVLSSLREELKKYTESLKKYEILSTKSGTVQEIVSDQGTMVGAGSEIIKVKEGEESKKEAICYISMTTGKKVVPGMQVMIYPTTVNKQEYGHMSGTVESVASYVTSAVDVKKKLGDDTLVQSFLNKGPVIEVVCSLKEDTDTASGYYWSSKKGAQVMLAEGTMLTASIVTEKKAPITMLIPYLKEKLTVPSTEEVLQKKQQASES